MIQSMGHMLGQSVAIPHPTMLALGVSLRKSQCKPSSYLQYIMAGSVDLLKLQALFFNMASSNLPHTSFQSEESCCLPLIFFLSIVGSREGRAERRALAQQVEQLRGELAHLKHSYQVIFRNIAHSHLWSGNQCVYSRDFTPGY